jgi:hypothetical protein
MPGGRPRGGRRAGAVGKAYPNRADLNGPQPIQAATGQPYGQAGAQRAAQAAVPVGTPGLPNPPQQGGPMNAPQAQVQGPVQGLPPGMPPPGSLGDLLGPSTDPNEHVMNGSARGPGVGPEAFGFGQGPDMSNLIRWLPALEQMANRPTATDATKNLVRIIKANVSLIPGNNQ